MDLEAIAALTAKYGPLGAVVGLVLYVVLPFVLKRVKPKAAPATPAPPADPAPPVLLPPTDPAAEDASFPLLRRLLKGLAGPAAVGSVHDLPRRAKLQLHQEVTELLAHDQDQRDAVAAFLVGRAVPTVPEASPAPKV